MSVTEEYLRAIPEDVFEAYERHLVPPFFGPWADRLLETADPQPGEHVLDLACGTGIVARLAASRVGETGAVTGLDLLPGMLAVARRVSAGSRPPIEWVEGDALELPLPDASFDIVLCQQGAQFFPDKVTALAEAHRVLRPDGRLVLNAWRALERNRGFAAVQTALEHHAPDAATFLPAAFSLSDAEQLRGYLSKAGFRDIRIRIELGTVRFESVEHYLREYLGGAPIAAIVAASPEEARLAIRAEVADTLHDYVDDEGLVFPMEAHAAIARA